MEHKLWIKPIEYLFLLSYTFFIQKKIKVSITYKYGLPNLVFSTLVLPSYILFLWLNKLTTTTGGIRKAKKE
jgi:hypothetical protein